MLNNKTYHEVIITLNTFKSHINVIPMSGNVVNISANYDVSKGSKVESTTEIATGLVIIILSRSLLVSSTNWLII